MQTISITISGRVQGVFFRQSTRERARALGITGSVRNLSDGNVEVIATGNREQLERLVSWCRQGPPKAVVTDVITRELTLQTFDTFEIERF